MSKLKIEIKSRWGGSVLFEYEKENNTLKDTLEQAVNEGADLRGADLTGAYLRGAYLTGAYLTGADLTGAYLTGAYLTGADLRGADLRGAYLTGADLRGADLRGADLTGAYLRGADLTGADLTGADLTGADLTGAYLYVSDDTINEKEIIRGVESNSNLKIKETYINKNIIPTKWNSFWKYGLIICDWEAKEVKKMTVSEICKELGYDVEIVKGEEE